MLLTLLTWNVISSELSYTETLPNSTVKLDMIYVPAGRVKINGTVIDVKPFYLAKTETPWEAFDVFTKSGRPSKAYDQTEFGPDVVARPSKSYILPDLGWGHNGFPAINVSYTSVEMFCRWLASETKKKYRLPTEAEWELACRAGMGDDWVPSQAEIDEGAWYLANSNRMTHPVGKKAANTFGFFDMLGNVGEWAVALDGKPVLCGGAYFDDAKLISPTTRRRYDPKWQETDPQIPKSRWWLSDGSFVGFRVACDAPQD